jgi:hypothetical protein
MFVLSGFRRSPLDPMPFCISDPTDPCAHTRLPFPAQQYYHVRPTPREALLADPCKPSPIPQPQGSSRQFVPEHRPPPHLVLLPSVAPMWLQLVHPATSTASIPSHTDLTASSNALGLKKTPSRVSSARSPRALSSRVRHTSSTLSY